MTPEKFRKYAHLVVDWMADYLEQVEKFPVKSQVTAGEIFAQLPDNAPQEGESLEMIFNDFQHIIMPGITHWQSPNFFAYFPANSSYPSLLAEMITATLGVQGMKWETSPAASELEEKVMNWLRDMIGLPARFHGVIQDTASTSTLVAILSAREKYSEYKVNEKGLRWTDEFRVYGSVETHSSIEKAVKIAGLGSNNLLKVPVDKEFRMNAQALRTAIEDDIKNGIRPLCVVATLGTTGSTAVDPLEEIADICSRYDIWLHVDAAFAGSALILPEYRWMLKGIEYADSFVFNPHKWLFTNFDCSAYFVKDKYALLRTLQIVPEYLRTQMQGRVNDYCDWGIQLGRRFRALKLWFVIRNFGINGLQEKLRFHIALAKELAEAMRQEEGFELLAPVTFNLVCFRYKPKGKESEDELNEINQRLLQNLNRTGRLFLSHTKLDGKFTLRMVIAQTNVEKRHVDEAWAIIREMARKG